jgi:hypothetical protein
VVVADSDPLSVDAGIPMAAAAARFAARKLSNIVVDVRDQTSNSDGYDPELMLPTLSSFSY